MSTDRQRAQRSPALLPILGRVLWPVLVATLALIAGFVYVPYGKLDSPRWGVAANFGTILVALVALVLAYQGYERYSQQIRREEAELIDAVAASIIEAFSAWPTIVLTAPRHGGGAAAAR